MLAYRQRCCAAARAASKSFYQGRHEQKKQVVEGMRGRGAWVEELPRNTWRSPSWPISPLLRPMLLLAMRGAKRGATPSTTPASLQRPKNPRSTAPASLQPINPRQQNTKQHPDTNATSGLFVRWEIPWDGKRVVITMTAVYASFLFSALGTVLLGFGYKLGQPLNPEETSVLLLTGLLLQSLFGVYAIKACIKSYSPLPKELFSYDWRNPFSARRGWLLWGVVGIFGAFAAVVPAAFLTSRSNFSLKNDILLQLQSLFGASGTSMALLLASIGVVAPFVEETVFRGFLLTSLTKWVPTYAAVLISAGAFAVIHFSAKSPVIFALGVVFGFSYAKTGNLLTPIMIHGVWNTTIILTLIFLYRQGYDVEKLLREPREVTFRWRTGQTPDCAEKK